MITTIGLLSALTLLWAVLTGNFFLAMLGAAGCGLCATLRGFDDHRREGKR